MFLNQHKECKNLKTNAEYPIVYVITNLIFILYPFVFSGTLLSALESYLSL